MYPNALDVPGKQVLIKIDSGPGEVMCDRLQNLGIYLCPGVPNTTAVTQETDLEYGKFKSGTQQNLADLCADQLAVG